MKQNARERPKDKEEAASEETSEDDNTSRRWLFRGFAHLTRAPAFAAFQCGERLLTD